MFVTGNRITDIKTVVDDANDPQSYQINENAIPQLRQQALQAQSSNIDGVSGATYTSQAYVDSLQSALDQLGWNN
ncbi:MAG TPA: FMN-binding protein [Acidimicrobiales bacterium]|nr:FMN-binding protein [Acidimicrobiales bacterium]